MAEAAKPPPDNRAPPVPAYCENMAALSCRPGTYSDGTGTAIGFTEKLGTIRKDVRTKIREYLSLNLETDPELKKWSNGLTLPECKQSEKSKCRDKMIEEALVQICTQLFPSGSMLVSEEEFKKAHRRIEKRIPSSSITKAKAIVEPLLGPKEMPQSQVQMVKDIKKEFESLLAKIPMKEDTRVSLIRKINEIEPNNDCSPYYTLLDERLKPNALYNWKTNKLSLCKGNSLFSSSAFTLINSIAHEIAHSIDPCFINADYPSRNSFLMPVNVTALKYSDPLNSETSLAENPFSEIIKCLRTEESVSARKSKSAKATGKNYFAFCHYPRDVTDQIQEAFADYTASEIVASYFAPKAITEKEFRNGISNLYRSPQACNKNYSDDHPSTPDRINRIYMAHPVIRERMGCPPHTINARYCGNEDWPKESSQTKPTSKGDGKL